jgi:hypothetical protein
MHELVGSDHSMTHVVVGSCQGETRTTGHTGISSAEEGWTVASDNETYFVAALTCNVLQQFALIVVSYLLPVSSTCSISSAGKAIPSASNNSWDDADVHTH